MSISTKLYNNIFEHNGDIMGCVKVVSIDSFQSEIINTYKIFLVNAKFITITLEVNSVVPMLLVENFKEAIYRIVSKKTKVEFGLSFNYKLLPEEIACKILICGVPVK